MKYNYTTNFNEWLDTSAIESADEAHSIQQAVLSTGENWGGYHTSKRGDQIFLHSDAHDCVLRLASEDAKEAFLKLLEALYELGLEGQRYYDKQMAKDD